MSEDLKRDKQCRLTLSKKLDYFQSFGLGLPKNGPYNAIINKEYKFEWFHHHMIVMWLCSIQAHGLVRERSVQADNEELHGWRCKQMPEFQTKQDRTETVAVEHAIVHLSGSRRRIGLLRGCFVRWKNLPVPSYEDETRTCHSTFIN